MRIARTLNLMPHFAKSTVLWELIESLDMSRLPLYQGLRLPKMNRDLHRDLKGIHVVLPLPWWHFIYFLPHARIVNHPQLPRSRGGRKEESVLPNALTKIESSTNETSLSISVYLHVYISVHVLRPI